MKKYLILISICLVGWVAKSQSSEQNDRDNTPNNGEAPCARPSIVTNPFAPQNTEWFTMRNRFNWMDYVTLHNNFKTRIPYFDNSNLYGGGNNSIRYFTNPFFDKDEDYLSHINLKNNFSLFINLGYETNFDNLQWLVDEMDITNVEHGWELLWKYDGYEADGVTPISGGMGGINTAANFILYNRYTGMLRWFTAPKVTGTSYNQLESLIEFSNENQVASLFRNYNGLDQALDKPTVVLRAASPAKTSFSIEHFSMADFNISYDPCVCHFQSKLDFKLNGFTSADINLYGRLEGTSQMLDEKSVINTDRLLSLYKDRLSTGFPNKVKNGLLEYKNYSKMVSDFKELENKSNVFDNVYDASKIVAEIADLGLSAVDPSKAAYKKLKILSKFTGYASMPFKTDKSTKSPPMLIQAQMTLTGELVSSTTLNGFSFDMFTPGSYKTDLDYAKLNSLSNNERFLYPVYNQAMGLYALLKTPKKEVGMNQTQTNVTITGVLALPTYDNMGRENGTRPIDSTTRSFRYHPRIAYKLKEDIAFTFNPSAQINFNATNMEAAWMFEVENDPSTLLLGGGTWIFTSPNVKRIYSYKNDQNKMITVYASEFFPLECIAQFVPVFDYALSPEAIRPVFVENPISNIERSLSSLLALKVSRYNFYRPIIVKTYLKINNLYRYNKPDGSGLNDIVNFETYKYEIEGNTVNSSILSLPNIELLEAPDELEIFSRHFTTSQTIFAWEKIKINGTLTTDPGVKVIIKSAGEIEVNPLSQIEKEIELVIGNPSICNQQRIQPTVVDRSYCTDAAKYKGNATLTKQASNDSRLDNRNNVATNHNAMGLILNIHPNPANHSFTINLSAVSTYAINITDITGRLVYTSEIVQNNKGIMDVSQLQNGIYFVQVTGNGHTTTQKIIVKH